MKKFLSLLLTFVMVVSILTVAPISTAASAETDRITNQIKETYTQAKSLSGRANFTNVCPIYVKYQLIALGITSTKDTDIYGNGNQVYNNITTGATSTGYTKTKYSGNNCLYNIINANSGNVYNIVVSWSYQYGASYSSPGAGHVLFIHAIIDNTVYFSDNYTYSGKAEGSPLIMSLSTFMSKWNGMYGNAIGAVHFTKSHTHSYDSYVYYWASHPHYKCYKCSCGDIKENRDEKVVLDTCSQCLDDYKATLKTDKNKYGIGETVTIKWDKIPNATHYNLWLYKRNDDGTSTRVSRDDLIKDTSFSYSGLAEGKYYTFFTTYNSNVWKQDHSDWFYSEADSIEFEITRKALPGKPELSVQVQTDEDYTLFTWKATTNTDSYTLHIFNETTQEKLPLITDIKELYCHVQLDAGKYTVFVASINDNLKDTNLWYTAGNSVTFRVKDGSFLPLSTIEYEGRRYELYDRSMPWEKAKNKCEELGGHLVTITSQEEMDAIKEIIPNGNRRAYWMGLSDLGKDGTWENITGETVSYTYWAKNQPDCFEDNEDCSVVQNGDDYKWNDVPHDCASYPIGFICEYENEKLDLLLGDTDGDGTVSIMDATFIQRHLAQIIAIDEDRFSCADTDKDGEISVMDATRIQRFIAQIIPEL